MCEKPTKPAASAPRASSTRRRRAASAEGLIRPQGSRIPRPPPRRHSASTPSSSLSMHTPPSRALPPPRRPSLLRLPSLRSPATTEPPSTNSGGLAGLSFALERLPQTPTISRLLHIIFPMARAAPWRVHERTQLADPSPGIDRSRTSRLATNRQSSTSPTATSSASSPTPRGDGRDSSTRSQPTPRAEDRRRDIGHRSHAPRTEQPTAGRARTASAPAGAPAARVAGTKRVSRGRAGRSSDAQGRTHAAKVPHEARDGATGTTDARAARSGDSDGCRDGSGNKGRRRETGRPPERGGKVTERVEQRAERDGAAASAHPAEWRGGGVEMRRRSGGPARGGRLGRDGRTGSEEMGRGGRDGARRRYCDGEREGGRQAASASLECERCRKAKGGAGNGGGSGTALTDTERKGQLGGAAATGELGGGQAGRQGEEGGNEEPQIERAERAGEQSDGKEGQKKEAGKKAFDRTSSASLGRDAEGMSKGEPWEVAERSRAVQRLAEINRVERQMQREENRRQAEVRRRQQREGTDGADDSNSKKAEKKVRFEDESSP